jgi:hypothetical protein
MFPTIKVGGSTGTLRIHIKRRRTWCISTDQGFSAKLTDIVGIYLDPPENALMHSIGDVKSLSDHITLRMKIVRPWNYCARLAL